MRDLLRPQLWPLAIASIFAFGCGAPKPPGPPAPLTPQARTIGSDADADGVVDRMDRCPLKAGLSAYSGCPDADGDRVPDDRDACATLRGTLAASGCPDMDGDTVADRDDRCPAKPGSVRHRGCPDTDADGWTDAQDRCPKVQGAAKTQGCPDGDSDGFADAKDRCPALAGLHSTDGCPSPDKLEGMIKGIVFEPGTDRMATSSVVTLQALAKTLAKYPNASFQVQVHVDQGDRTLAQALLASQRRAVAIRAVLSAQAVDLDHVKVIGYGATVPKVVDGAAWERRLNNRVTLKVVSR